MDWDLKYHLNKYLYMKNTKNSTQNLDFTTLKISLSSPEDVLAKSHGEVVKPETINYRTYKPEIGAFFVKEYLVQLKTTNVIVVNTKN